MKRLGGKRADKENKKQIREAHPFVFFFIDKHDRCYAGWRDAALLPLLSLSPPSALHKATEFQRDPRYLSWVGAQWGN
jgi:hypothetical protein